MTRKCTFLVKIRHKKCLKTAHFASKTLKKSTFCHVFDAFFNGFSLFLSRKFPTHSKPNCYFSTLKNVIGKNGPLTSITQ